MERRVFGRRCQFPLGSRVGHRTSEHEQQHRRCPVWEAPRPDQDTVGMAGMAGRPGDSLEVSQRPYDRADDEWKPMMPGLEGMRPAGGELRSPARGASWRNCRRQCRSTGTAPKRRGYDYPRCNDRAHDRRSHTRGVRVQRRNPGSSDSRHPGYDVFCPVREYHRPTRDDSLAWCAPRQRVRWIDHDTIAKFRWGAPSPIARRALPRCWRLLVP